MLPRCGRPWTSPTRCGDQDRDPSAGASHHRPGPRDPGRRRRPAGATQAGRPAAAGVARSRPRSRRAAAHHRRDNPERIRDELAFAALCRVSPIPASSGRTDRHRLNQGGDRMANRTLYIVAVNRMRCHPETLTYVERRREQGLSNKDISRCLKRYIARQVYPLILESLRIRPP
ncbi:hypothetical protein DLE60_03395 [Micromonospora globispora]|uniref:transposase n=1 Tax=Micromonospora globispora TaxID=1450148 RepID=UPI000D6F4AEE|nr:transposase [Micromonospora globispora]PWU61855.1 hypothetical protein DLE60_03395 [Micromonospora globispora]RQW98462.1 hypothetical protein DKL51_10440 [Micromonospora globispora]